MLYRHATPDDVPVLAAMNQQLIQDERHNNTMSLPELEERMLTWITTDYQAILFHIESRVVAYALYREAPDSIYLRQFFVHRDLRRAGHGRESMQLLRFNIWPQNKRILVEVLCHNAAALSFWRAVGFADYSLTLEILPDQQLRTAGQEH